MWIGLGNPGQIYQGTRHNVGFEWVDHLFETFSFGPIQHHRLYDLYPVRIEGREGRLLKPLTYMNLSGNAVMTFLQDTPIAAEHLLVVYDDVSLPIGKMRLRQEGSHGGHNGLRHILACAGHTQIPRLRIGVGAPPDGVALHDYVLAPFAPAEREIVEKVLENAAKAARMLLLENVQNAMAAFNGLDMRADMQGEAASGPDASN
ncbi:MAG: aminoacyl-tRNA hydrolase [Acidobacteria bacterium]|nr:aminoacyl-tRNA hydrolase [Acidobacteriota bacterium]